MAPAHRQAMPQRQVVVLVGKLAAGRRLVMPRCHLAINEARGLLVRRTVPMVEPAIALSRLPVLRATNNDPVARRRPQVADGLSLGMSQTRGQG